MSNKTQTVTKIMIGILVAFHFMTNGNDDLRNALCFWGQGVLQGEVWRLVTGALLHGDMIHLFFNCFFMWQVFPWVAESFGMTKAQIALWLSVVGGAVLSGAMDLMQPGVGISGGLFGLFGIYILSLWTIKQYRNTPDIRSSLTSALMMLGLNLYLGMTIPNISNAGHIGGLIVGLILGKIYLRPQISKVTD